MPKNRVIKCEGCNAPIDCATTAKVITCRYCGTNQVVPELVEKPTVLPTRPKVVVSGVKPRDILIGVVIALVVLGFVVAAIMSSGGGPRNLLTGEVRGKNDPGARETLMTVSRKGVTEKTADTGYSLKVWVESEKREYEVMVEKAVWEGKKIGDQLQFLRPPSEQK